MADEQVDRYGIPIPEEQTIASPVTGRRKTFAGLQWSEWALVAVTIVNIFLTLGLTSYRLIHSLVNDKDSAFASSPDFTFALLILVNSVFCLFYVINGILREKEFELYALVAAILVILVYCIIEYSVNDDPKTNGRTTIKLVRLIAVCVLAPINFGLCIFVARDFGWLEFKIVGASEALQLMYRDASRLSSLLKFSVQLSFSLVLLVMRDGVDVDVLEIVVLALGLPLSVFLAVIGWLAVRYERRWLVGVYVLLSLSLPAYIIYKLIESFGDLGTSAGVQLNQDDDKVILGTVIGAGFLGLLLQGVIYVETYRCFNNFGKGLKERAFDAEANERTSLLVRHRRR